MPSEIVYTPAHPFTWSHGRHNLRFALLRPIKVEVRYEIDEGANGVKVSSFEATPSPAASVALELLKQPTKPVTFERPPRRGAVGQRVVTGETLELADVTLPLSVRIAKRYVMCRNRSAPAAAGLRPRFPQFYFQARIALRYTWTLTQSSVVFNNRGEPIEQAPRTIVSKRTADDAPPWNVRYAERVGGANALRCEPVPRNTPTNRLYQADLIEKDLRS